MKKKVAVHVYQNREYKGKYQSMTEASNIAGIKPQTVMKILKGEQECTKQGFYFSYNQLTHEEIEQLPIRDTLPTKKGLARHDGRSYRKIVENSVFEVDYANPQIFHQPRSKRERIELFKIFLFTKLHNRWMTIPKSLATLERQYIRETLSSLE